MWIESSPIRFRKVGILVLMVMTSLGHASIVLYDYFIMVRRKIKKLSAVLIPQRSNANVGLDVSFASKKAFHFIS